MSMMKHWSVLIFALFVSWSSATAQQTDSTALKPLETGEISHDESNGLKIEEGALDKDESDSQDKDKAAQAGRTIGAQLKDEKLESKEGPDGEPIFVNADGQYYYINRKGQKIFLDKTEMKAK